MGASILILTGPPGTGKTTAAAALGKRSARSAHIESDAFFRSIRSGFIEPWRPESHAQNEVVMRAVAVAALEYAHAGYFTILDGIVLPRWFLPPLRTAFEHSGIPTAYAVLWAPLETCLARCGGRDQLLEPGAIEGLWQQFAELGELETHAVDVTGLAPDQVVNLISSRLDDGSLAL